jgi:hypothetical protein
MVYQTQIEKDIPLGNGKRKNDQATNTGLYRLVAIRFINIS